MKITVEYNLPDHQWIYDQHHHAPKAWATLDQIQQTLRSHFKYGECEDPNQLLEQIYLQVCETTQHLEQ